MSTAPQVIERARHLLDAGDPAGAINVVDRYLITVPPPPPAGLHLLTGLAYLRIDSPQAPLMAMHSMEAELVVDPTSAVAAEHLRELLAKYHKLGSFVPKERQWYSALAPAAADALEMASQRYTYRGVPMVKNCFDLALYPL